MCRFKTWHPTLSPWCCGNCLATERHITAFVRCWSRCSLFAHATVVAVHARSLSIKAIDVYPLHRQWRQQLGVKQPPEFTPDADDWARHEFAHVKLHDKRLKKRVITVSRAFMQHSTGSMPQWRGLARLAPKPAALRG